MRILLVIFIIAGVQVSAGEFSFLEDQNSRLGMSYGVGALQYSGDIQGLSPSTHAFQMGGEFLHSWYSSTYSYTISSSSDNRVKIVSLEKGYFYYLGGSENNLKRRFEFRVGALLGLASFGLHDTTLEGVYYARASTIAYFGGIEAEVIYKAHDRAYIGLGMRRQYLTGAQDILWQAQGDVLKLSVHFPF